MKKPLFLSILCSVLCLASCSDDSMNNVDNKHHGSLSESLIRDVIKISENYGYTPSDNFGPTVQYAAGDNTEKKEKRSDYGWSDIAMADARGFVEGAMLGSGSGNIWVVIATGVGLGVYDSVDCYENEKEKGGTGGGNDGGTGGGNDGGTGENNNEVPFYFDGNGPLDLRNPFYDEFDFASKFSTELLPYVQAGIWHGTLSRALAKDGPYLSLEDEQQIKYVFNTVNTYKENIVAGIGGNLNDESFDKLLADICSDSSEVIAKMQEMEHLSFEELLELNPNLHTSLKVFMQTLRSIDLTEIYDYSNQFMVLVHKHRLSGDISVYDAFLINSTIAVYLNSNAIWRRFIPRIHGDNGYVFKLVDDSKWSYSRDMSQVVGLLDDDMIEFLGVPNIMEEEFTEIFFFDSFDEYEYWFGAHPAYLMGMPQMTIGDIIVPEDINITHHSNLDYEFRPLDFCSGIFYYSLVEN